MEPKRARDVAGRELGARIARAALIRRLPPLEACVRPRGVTESRCATILALIGPWKVVERQVALCRVRPKTLSDRCIMPDATIGKAILLRLLSDQTN